MKTDNSIKNISLKENSYNSQNRCQINNLEVKIGIELEELEQAKQLWLELSNNNSTAQQSQHQLDNREALIYDGYDSYAKHLIVRDKAVNKVIAYVRIIDSHTAYNIGGYFCEAQFNLEILRLQMQSAMELSRLVIDPEYNHANTLDILWSGIVSLANEYDSDTLFGTLPLDLNESYYSTGKEIKRLKSTHLATNKYRVMPYHMLPSVPKVFSNDAVDCNLPEAVNFFFNKGARLCGDAGWNKVFNQAELFFYIKIGLLNQVPQCIRQNEINIAGLVA